MAGKSGRRTKRAKANDIVAATDANAPPPLIPIPMIDNNSANNDFVNTKNVINVQPFDGDASKLDFFIKQIKDSATIAGWSDRYTIVYTTSKLIGKALEYIIQRQSIKEFDNIDELFEKLQTFFKPTSLAQHLKNWEELKRLPEESIENLKHRIEFLANKMYPSDSDPSTINTVKFYKLIQLVPENIRFKIFNEKITDFEMATQVATLFEDCLVNSKTLSNTNDYDKVDLLSEQVNVLKTQFSNIQNSNNSTLNSSSPKRDLANKGKGKKIFHNKGNRGSRRNFNANYKFKIGNNSRTFKPRRNNDHNRGHFTNNRHRGEWGVKCQWCSAFGHTAKACFALQAQNQFPTPQNQFQLPSSSNNPQVTFPSFS